MSSENDIKFILNEKNTPITKKYIQDILKKYSVTIKVKYLGNFQRSMVHLSYLIRDGNFYKNNKTKPYQIQTANIDPITNEKEAIPLQYESYERLEYMGDAVIHLILAEYLYHRYSDEDEGFMTKLRTKLENGDMLSILGKKIGLDKYIVISRYIEINDGRNNNNKILEDAFEAFIGALQLDAGFDMCKKFIVNLIETEIDFATILSTETNFKEKLLQYFHIQKWLDPIYGTSDVYGPENKKIYKTFVTRRKNYQDTGDVVGWGEGQSKKKGEQLAAKNALKHFGVGQSEDSDEEIFEL